MGCDPENYFTIGKLHHLKFQRLYYKLELNKLKKMNKNFIIGLDPSELTHFTLSLYGATIIRLRTR